MIRYIFFIVILSSSIIQAKTYHVNSVKEINDKILSLLEKRSAEKTLVAVPLQQFIIKIADPEFYVSDQKYAPTIKKIFGSIKSSKKDFIEECKLTEYKQKIVDPYVIEFIKNIQQLNVPIIAFSNNCSGEFNDIKFLEVWTWQYLLSLGIDLSKSSIGMKQILFNKYFEMLKGSYPTYYKGLLSLSYKDGKNEFHSVLPFMLSEKFNNFAEVVYVILNDEESIKILEKQLKAVRSDIQVETFVLSPSIEYRNDLSISRIESFLQDFVSKLNKVKRGKIKILENPYD